LVASPPSVESLQIAVFVPAIERRPITSRKARVGLPIRVASNRLGTPLIGCVVALTTLVTAPSRKTLAVQVEDGMRQSSNSSTGVPVVPCRNRTLCTSVLVEKLSIAISVSRLVVSMS
jgi:hypothetical protein